VTDATALSGTLDILFVNGSFPRGPRKPSESGYRYSKIYRAPSFQEARKGCSMNSGVMMINQVSTAYHYGVRLDVKMREQWSRPSKRWS
jgi:hypothetical protein